MGEIKTIGFAVKNLSNEIKRAIDRNFRSSCQQDHQEHREPDEMTVMQRWIIKYLYDSEKAGAEVFQKDLENRFNIRRSTVTGILQLMEKNGYVQRVAVAHDARLKRLVLTRKGSEMQKMVDLEVKQMEAKFVQGIPPEELEIFFKVVAKIEANCRE